MDNRETEPPTKKRIAEKQMRREEDGDDEVAEEDSGKGFQRADPATIAARRKVTVRRRNNAPVPESVSVAVPEPISWPTFNWKPSEENKETKPQTPEKEGTTPAPAPALPSFSFSTQFTFASTQSPALFSIPLPTFAPTAAPPKEGSIFGVDIAKPSVIPEPGPSTQDDVPIPVKKSDLPTEPVPSGEEGERNVFVNRMKAYILEGTEWKERGVGPLKVNIADDKTYARLVMRAEGALRLVLNVRLFSSMKIEPVGDKAARFVAPHIDRPSELATYLVRAGKPEFIASFVESVEAYKNIGHGASTPKKEQSTPQKETTPSTPNKEATPKKGTPSKTE
jgi:hypothetical protein